MYRKWLDRWDEQRARMGEAGKKPACFLLDSDRAFFEGAKADCVESFCSLAERAATDPAFFTAPHCENERYDRAGGFLRFPSDISTDIEANNVVWTKITENGQTRKAIVVFHHWNANARNHQIAKFFAKRGVTVLEMALPYHFERSRPGSEHADYMLGPNPGRTVQSIKQAVWDGQKLIRWLKREGYNEIFVLGMSLGSWVAGLIAAHDPAVSKASLFLTAGSLADMVWTGRATRSIRESLQHEMKLIELRRAWAPLNLENYANQLARPDLDLHIVLAKRDRVVLPELSGKLVECLKRAGARPDVLELDCGHYSLARLPFILFAGLSLSRFLMRP